jgi:hypothetical protein
MATNNSLLHLLVVSYQTNGVSGLRLEHRLPKAGIDHMDVFECRFLFLVSEDFLQIGYGHAVIDIVRAEPVCSDAWPVAFACPPSGTIRAIFVSQGLFIGVVRLLVE